MSPASFTSWRAATLVLYGLAAGVGLVATVRSFDRDLDIVLVIWTFGMVAAFFGCGMAVMAAVAFARQDDDRLDLRSFMAATLFLVSSPATTGVAGIVAAGVLATAWLSGRLVRRRQRRAWRAEYLQRRAAAGRMGRSDPRQDPDVSCSSSAAPVPPDRTEERPPVSDDGYAVTRRELKERARAFDQDPWQLPPN